MKDSKNSFRSYDSYNIEDCRYCMVAEYNQDCMDTTIFNPHASLVYENICGGNEVKNAYSCLMMRESSQMYFCDFCVNCSHMIGCVNMHHKQYCIFNKQYTKEERERLAPIILEQLQKEGLRGEFIPTSQCPFPYNDSVAMDYFPIYAVQHPDGKKEIIDSEGTGTVILESEDFIASAHLDL